MSMAKITQSVTSEVTEVDQSPSFFQKLFYWFLIPLMFLVAVVLVVAQISGVNVFEKARETANVLPFVSSEQQSTSESQAAGEKVVELQAEIMEKETQIAELQTQLSGVSSENEQLLIEQEKLLYEIETLKRENNASELEFQEVLTTYEKMSPKKIAAAVVQLNDAEALRILSNLKTDTVAKVFEKMEPERVAHYTSLMTE